MASGLTAGTVSKPSGLIFTSLLLQKQITTTSLSLPLIRHKNLPHCGFKVPRKTSFAVCFVVDYQTKPVRAHLENQQEEEPEEVNKNLILTPRVAERLARKQKGGKVSWPEMFGTFTLSVGAAVGMEFWARWAHKELWHSSLWNMHESHHRPRDGAFELNDVFAIINAVPAISLAAYGFFNRGLVPGLCFGAGLGITVFGIAYMFVHDGLVHKRFPVGPIADVPYFTRVAAAHQIHHSDKFNGVPYGLFLGHKEIEEVGGQEELEREISRRTKSSKGV